MQKKEFLHLQLLIFPVRIYSGGITSDEIRTDRYNSLEISPLHIHKDKKAHKDALLTPGDEIGSHILGRNLPAEDYSQKTVPLLAAADH